MVSVNLPFNLFPRLKPNLFSLLYIQHVRFHIQYGRPCHNIDFGQNKSRLLLPLPLHPYEACEGEADGGKAVGGASGEHALLLHASGKARWSHLTRVGEG